MTLALENRTTGEDLQFPTAWGRLCGKSFGFVKSALQTLLHTMASRIPPIAGLIPLQRQHAMQRVYTLTSCSLQIWYLKLTGALVTLRHRCSLTAHGPLMLWLTGIH